MRLNKIGLLLGGVLAMAILLFADLDGHPDTTRMAAIAVLMSVFWITEAIPLAATALIPLGLLPLLGIASSKNVAAQYMNSTVFLLLGGFMIALAMQRWQLHKRIALTVLSRFGGHPGALLCGFMLASAGLSMWISNTATTLMMLPIALAILSRYETLLTAEQGHRFTVALLLSIAYSASIGGMMTLVGTAPNLVFARFYEAVSGQTIGFAQWMILSLPIGLIMLIALGVIVAGLYIRKLPPSAELKQVVLREKNALGALRYEEKMVLLVFAVTALLWITRKGIRIGAWQLQGWGDILLYGKMIDDGSVAIFMAMLLFFIPARTGGLTTLLDETVFINLPWSIVLLFGGGFALAYGFSESGLSVYLASQLQGLDAAELPLIVFSVTAGMSLLTEMTSNTATTQLVMPILLSVSEVIKVSPVFLMLPATLAASCAFMFPVATPPNAIIFGSGKIRVIEMVTLGFLLNTVAIGIISSMTCLGLATVFDL